MARTQKEKVILAVYEGETESASSDDERPPEKRTKNGLITPPEEEKCDATHKELPRSSEDCDRYFASVSSAAEIRERERRTVSSEIQALEKARIREIRQQKEYQCEFLKPYFMEMVARRKLNWYKEVGETSSARKPKRIEELTCECHLEEEYKIFENTGKKCKNKEEKPTDKSIEYPFQHLAQHNTTCNVKRISTYISDVAEYFIDEEVDPDMFLFTPAPIEEEEKEFAVYNNLQENRKVLIVKLSDGLKRKYESMEEGMPVKDVFRCIDINEMRMTRYLVLMHMLKRLIKPFVNYFEQQQRNSRLFSRENNDADNDDHSDDSNQKRLQKKDSKTCYGELLTDDGIHAVDYYITLEEYQERQKKSEENISSNS